VPRRATPVLPVLALLAAIACPARAQYLDAGPRASRRTDASIAPEGGDLDAGPRASRRADASTARAPDRDAGERPIVLPTIVGGDGDVDLVLIGTRMRTAFGALAACYRAELPAHPTLAGRLDVLFTVNTNGRVTAVRTTGLVAAPRVGACVAGVVRGTVFPPPAGGAVDFSFQLNFIP
jgi:hypothetical protein